MPPLITFVVTCKGRLEHLKQSLPRLAAQKNAEVVVVDSRCPDGAGAWVKENYPAARVAFRDVDDAFNLAACRNVGLRAATAKWVCFTDADVVVRETFTQEIAPHLTEGTVLQFERCNHKVGLGGTCVVERARVNEVGGYDEAFRGWGGEDKDLLLRLQFAGVTSKVLPHDYVETVIHHTDPERTRFHEQKDKSLAQTAAALYRAVKFEFFVNGSDFIADLERRKGLFAEAEHAVAVAAAAEDRTVKLAVPVPPHPSIEFHSAKVRRRVVIEIELPPRKI